MLKLYEIPLSPYVQKVRIALHEKGLEFESSSPNFLGTPDAEFLRVSPRREIPVLADGDVVVFDSTIILEYIEERWPDPPLMPTTAAARARARSIEDVCDTYFEANTWALFEIQVFRRAKGELAERLTARAGEEIKGIHAYLERQLGEGPFYGGDIFGWGDVSVFPHVASAARMGFPPPAGSKLAAWFTRAGERPSTKKTIEAVQQTIANLPDLAALLASGSVVRQYRDHRLEWMIRNGGLEIVTEGMAKKNIRFSTPIE